MAHEGRRRLRDPRRYEVLVTSLGEGRSARAFRVSRVWLVLMGVLAVLAIVGLTLAVLMFTPAAMYVPLPNPILEQRYGEQIRETQVRLNDLAEQVLLLSDYNTQLRKALGEGSTGDSMMFADSPSVLADTGSVPQAFAATRPDTSSAPVASEQYDIMVATGQGIVALGEETSVEGRLPLIMPAEGFVSQLFDPGRGHFGMDIAARRGTPVIAPADGHVVFAGWTYEDGNMIILAHGRGYMTVYKHNQSVLRSAQESVRRGEAIALLGTSGRTSQGPHLHFEVWRDGVPRDPRLYLIAQTAAQYAEGSNGGQTSGKR
jgi:murein DD-endopeptidase MepM/ murein hydrolase activator NlpD